MCCFVILLLSNEMQMSVRRFSAIPHLGEREHPVRNASNWEKINFFITGDKFRTFLDMPSFAPS